MSAPLWATQRCARGSPRSQGSNFVVIFSPAGPQPNPSSPSGNGMDRPRSRPQRLSECLGGLPGEGAPSMPRASTVHAVIAIGIDLGKNTLHMIGLDSSGAIVLREKVSRGRIASRLANLPPCLIGIEAGMATHYVARELTALGHDVKQVPATYAKPFRQGHKNDFRDAHAVAEAVQRPTTRLGR